MKRDGLIKPAAIAFVIALVVYFAAYTGIEHRRTRNGPWQVTFTNDASGSPMLVIDQPALQLTNVSIVFLNEPRTNSNPEHIQFYQARLVPFDLPFGKCVFMDTTFLPGTLVFEMFGHEVQLIPRVLLVDRVERAWESGSTMSIAPKNTATAENIAH